MFFIAENLQAKNAKNSQKAYPILMQMHLCVQSISL